jgi:nucleotide-binding universal stress UspA family protein
MVGYNGSPESRTAVKLAGQMAKPLEAKVLIVLSMEGGAKEKLTDIKKAETLLAEERKILETEGIQCEVFQTARGLSPAEDIVDFAKENEVDMIIVGIEKKSRAQKLILGSTAQYIILKASCPVLTVK